MNKILPANNDDMFGMSSDSLSFSTVQYMQRHGLVQGNNNYANAIPNSSPSGANSARNGPPEPGIAYNDNNNKCGPYRSPNCQGMLNPSDRILDLTSLKNQPKLL